MNIVRCEKCGGNTPEGFSLCSTCLQESGADENEVNAVLEMMEIANITNIGDTHKSQNAAIDSILKIKSRLEE